MERDKQIVQVLRDIRGLMAYQQSCSIADYPRSTDLQSFLQNCNWQSPATVVPAGQQQVPATVEPSRTAPAAGNVATATRGGAKKLAEIAAEISRCTACSLSEQRTCSVPGGGNGEQIRLLLIGHWLSPGGGSPSAVFGEEEDLMLKRMLTAIHLPLDQVFITNVIKCGVGSDTQPQAEHIDACSSYLKRQIAAAAPQLICAMGMVATKALLRLPQPLSRLRGRFYTYQGEGGLEIPLLPTYHPGYLLQNPEMKKATWHDLQLLEKRLLELEKPST